MFGRWFARTSLLLAPLAVLAWTHPANAEERRVVLISIDGLSPYFYLTPAKYGLKIPTLLSLVKSGVAAEGMRGVYPSVTYPSHTTIVTGVTPAKHGIVGNFVTGSSWYLHSKDIKVETLWDAAKAHGLSTAIVTWPVSYGARVDHLIPENLAFEPERDLLTLIREGASPGLFEEIERAVGPPPPHLPFGHPEAGVPLDTMTGDFAAYVLRAKRPAFVAMHFLDLDHRRHSYGSVSAEAMEALEFVDRQLEKVTRAVREAGLAETTTFVIVSDHGFIEVHTAINVAALGAEILPGPDPPLRITSSGGSAAVYVTDPAREAEVAAAVRGHVRRRYAGLVSVVERDRLDELGALPDAVLALEAADGFNFVNRPTAVEVLVPARPGRATHGYLPTNPKMLAAFVMSGAGVDPGQRGRVIPPVRMVDVAPTMAAILGLRLPQADGVPLTGLLAPPR